MKILIVADAQSIHTIRWKAALEKRGFVVAVASFREGTGVGKYFFKLSNFGLGKMGYVLAVPRLNKIISSFSPDIVHAHYISSYGFLCVLAGVKKLVVTAWGSDVLVSPEHSWIMKKIVQYTLQRSAQITTVAAHMTEAVKKLGAREENVSTIPFGVNIEVFKPYPRKTDSFQDIPILISTRNFAKVYDIPTIIRSASILQKKGIRFKLWLVGGGILRSNLESLVAELGLENEVDFKGHLSQENLVECLHQADIFISSSLSDGNNISLNEAMISGCFPIATDIEANRQWIEHGKNGLLYSGGSVQQLSECIERALHDPSLRINSMMPNIEIIKNRASWDTCVNKTVEIYKRLRGA
ncbi:glycosyltransferase [Bdellovibrio sp. HCB-162]|uniref:glycosyltransferase n=1 Tax=Bdellovibrio sp. HCB-162 TaxID=3394234 RepID=UPI0039BC8881